MTSSISDLGLLSDDAFNLEGDDVRELEAEAARTAVAGQMAIEDDTEIQKILTTIQEAAELRNKIVPEELLDPITKQRIETVAMAYCEHVYDEASIKSASERFPRCLFCQEMLYFLPPDQILNKKHLKKMDEIEIVQRRRILQRACDNPLLYPEEISFEAAVAEAEEEKINVAAPPPEDIHESFISIRIGRRNMPEVILGVNFPRNDRVINTTIQAYLTQLDRLSQVQMLENMPMRIKLSLLVGVHFCIMPPLIGTLFFMSILTGLAKENPRITITTALALTALFGAFYADQLPELNLDTIRNITSPLWNTSTNFSSELSSDRQEGL